MITGSIDALRRLTNEPSSSGTYTDSAMTQYLLWASGDMYGAGYMIWTEKIAALEGTYDYKTDGESFSLNQKIEHAEKMKAFCANHRGAITSLWLKDPPETGTVDEEDLQE